MSQRQFLQSQQYPLCVLLGGTGLQEVGGEVQVVCALLRSSFGDALVTPASAGTLVSCWSQLGRMFRYLKSSTGSLFAPHFHCVPGLWLRCTQRMQPIARRHSHSGHGAC